MATIMTIHMGTSQESSGEPPSDRHGHSDVGRHRPAISRISKPRRARLGWQVPRRRRAGPGAEGLAKDRGRRLGCSRLPRYFWLVQVGVE